VVEGPGVGHELLRELLQRRVVVDDHLPEAGEGGVGLVLRHLVGRVEQPQDGLAVVHLGQEGHQLDVDGDEVEVHRAQLEVDGDIEGDLAGVDCGQKLGDVVLEVEQVHEGVVVEGEDAYPGEPEAGGGGRNGGVTVDGVVVNFCTSLVHSDKF
jgi:hypothetical protein